MLSRYYGFTPETIAGMTPYQQMVYLQGMDERAGAVPPGKSAAAARDELRRKRAEFLKKAGGKS